MSKKTKIGIGVAVVVVIGIVVGILVTRPRGDFTLPATVAASVPIGRQGTVSLTLTPPPGQSLPSGDINLSIKETLPAGVRVSFSPNPIRVTDRTRPVSATMTVDVGTAARPGTYTLTVVASGGGVTRESRFTLTVQVAPDYSLEAAPAAITVRQGATGTVTVNVRRNETMRDPVDLTVEGAPTGVRVTVDPTRVPADRASATLRIEVGPTVEAKDYTLTIRGRATGIADKTATLRLTVQAVDFSLEAKPSVLTLKPGESATVTIAIVRTNLTDPVAFTAKNLPAGLSATFNPASAAGNETVLTISAAADAAPGTYSFTVEGAAAGKTKSVTISVTIGG